MGNKCDMDDERVVASERGRQLSEHLGEFIFSRFNGAFEAKLRLATNSPPTIGQKHRKHRLNLKFHLSNLWLSSQLPVLSLFTERHLIYMAAYTVNSTMSLHLNYFIAVLAIIS